MQILMQILVNSSKPLYAAMQKSTQFHVDACPSCKANFLYAKSLNPQARMLNARPRLLKERKQISMYNIQRPIRIPLPNNTRDINLRSPLRNHLDINLLPPLISNLIPAPRH